MHEVPEDYIVPEQLPGMLESANEMRPPVAVIGETPRRGLRVGKWFIREFYVSREEPLLEAHERSRLILWRPIGKEPSRRWFRFPLEMDLKRATAFTIVHPDYASSWSSTAQRDLRHARERGVRIEVVPFDAFMAHMPRTGKFRTLYGYMSWQARRFNDTYGESMRWYLAYTKDGAVAAALGVLYLPAHNFSMSGTSYSVKEADERSAPVALRDRWHRDALALGITYLDWNALWRPGDDRTWKGFGVFKEKFGPRVVYLPPTYATFVPSLSLARALSRLRRLFPAGARASRADR